METKDDTNGGKIHNCKICGKEYKKRQKMSEHIETHLDRFTFPCKFCEKTLNTRTGLRAHIIYNHTAKKTGLLPKEEKMEHQDDILDAYNLTFNSPNSRKISKSFKICTEKKLRNWPRSYIPLCALQ